MRTYCSSCSFYCSDTAHTSLRTREAPCRSLEARAQQEQQQHQHQKIKMFTATYTLFTLFDSRRIPAFFVCCLFSRQGLSHARTNARINPYANAKNKNTPHTAPNIKKRTPPPTAFRPSGRFAAFLVFVVGERGFPVFPAHNQFPTP